MPWVDELLDRLGNAWFFTTLDLTNQSRRKTLSSPLHTVCSNLSHFVRLVQSPGHFPVPHGARGSQCPVVSSCKARHPRVWLDAALTWVGQWGGGVLWVCCSGALGCSAKEAEDQVEGIQLINAPLFVVTLRTTVCVQRQSTQGADQRYSQKFSCSYHWHEYRSIRSVNYLFELFFLFGWNGTACIFNELVYIQFHINA